MMDGLMAVQEKLLEIGAGLRYKLETPPNVCKEYSKKASLIVLDRGYLKINRDWYDEILRLVSCPVFQVESNVVVPVEEASNKEEYSAATIRRKINSKIEKYLIDYPLVKLNRYYKGENETINHQKLDELELEKIPKSLEYIGGYKEADKHLHEFITEKLDKYHVNKNDPSLDFMSKMSPYLHFGQISPVEIAIRIIESGSKGAEHYLEELIVRRELAINFVHYNPYYYSYDCIPTWCKETLDEHRKDPRPYSYSLTELEHGETHDPYWNAAQQEMVKTGKMHGYMRMYWGKKIIEWTSSPETAYKHALYLNNKYELDGRDPNGYAGVAWCFGKHDRPWKERSIFGKIRYMNDRGLERKFKIDKYAEKWRL
jgi:deoxyribodipyrimidine photo-lyase